MQPIISIVGKSESGKTTLLEALITELSRRGHKVAVIKHTGEDCDFDTVNKDTWRFRRAGGAISAIASAHHAAVYYDAENYSPEDFSLAVAGCDLILTEGFKQSSYPKIEVHRKEQGAGLVSRPEQLVAAVTDEPLDINVPQFTPGSASEIADLIENTFMPSAGIEVDLFQNGAAISTTPYLRSLLARTLNAMVPVRAGSGDIETLHISLRRKR